MTTSWVIAPDVAWTGDAGRVVALHLPTVGATPQAMEGPAAAIWMTIADGPATIHEIAAKLSEEFAALPGDLEPDVVRFVEQLDAAHLIAPATGGEGA